MTANELSLVNIKNCRGCNNANFTGDELTTKIKAELDKSKFEQKLKEHAKSKKLYNHPFQITLARCPNGCSRPQIAEISIIAINRPIITEVECINCKKCMNTCIDNAIEVKDSNLIIDCELCVNCGSCISVCPTGTLSSEGTEYQFSVGGRLGRHPRFAITMGPTSSMEQLLEWIKHTINIYTENMQDNERFSNVLDRYGIEEFKLELK